MESRLGRPRQPSILEGNRRGREKRQKSNVASIKAFPVSPSVPVRVFKLWRESDSVVRMMVKGVERNGLLGRKSCGEKFTVSMR